MDLELSPDEQLLDDAVRAIFVDQAGTARSRALAGAVDRELVERLNSGGFLDVLAADSGLGPIAGVLVAERAAAAAAAAPLTARVLVGPLAGFTDLPPTVGLVSGPDGLV